MADHLHPTPARKALLDQIDNGQVLTDITAENISDGFPVILFPDAPTSYQNQVTVTAKVRELEKAGWAEELPNGLDWQTTPLGRAIRQVRVLERTAHIIAETGDPDAPCVLGEAWRDLGGIWAVRVKGQVDVALRDKHHAREELRHLAALALAADTTTVQEGH